MLTATAYVVFTYGQSVYYVAFHKPLHLGTVRTPMHQYAQPIMPIFHISQNISSYSLAPGETEKVNIFAVSNQTIAADVEVWIEGPLNTQVYQSSPTGSPIKFIKGTTQRLAYSYILPRATQKGTYRVSIIITSPNNQTDYFVKPNFASFTVL